MLNDANVDISGKDTQTKKFKKSFNSSRNKSLGVSPRAPRDVSSTLFPVAKVNPAVELNFQMGLPPAAKEKQSSLATQRNLSLQTATSLHGGKQKN